MSSYTNGLGMRGILVISGYLFTRKGDIRVKLTRILGK
jgi:hypothetical protein